MANNAHISILGTVMQDPTNRQVNNSSVLSMRVAVKTTKKQENSQWPASDVYDVSVWGKLGENLMNRIKAKTKVWVCGDFMLGETWTDRNGKEHQSLRITANHVEPVSNGSSSGNYNNNNSNNNVPAPADEEEAPF